MIYNAVEMFSDELNIGLAAFKKRCIETSDLVIDQIRTKELLSNPLQLACDIKLKGSETPFITKGTDLGRHLDQFIQSLPRNSEFESSPQILPTAQINDYLQAKIGRKFEKIIKKLLKSKKSALFTSHLLMIRTLKI